VPDRLDETLARAALADSQGMRSPRAGHQPPDHRAAEPDVQIRQRRLRPNGNRTSRGPIEHVEFGSAVAARGGQLRMDPVKPGWADSVA
jgi:hypothetical protein